MTLAAQNLEYTDDATTLEGVVVLDETRSDQRPGILLIHGGAGLDDHARGQAHRYAELGYVVFACDMYGRGIAGDRERVMATLMGLRDAPDRLAQRAAAGLAALSARADVNGRLAAVGFCFGGLAALTLARSGASLAAVVSMHGSLATAKRAEPGAVTAKVLVCHGALDPHVPMADVVAELRIVSTRGASAASQRSPAKEAAPRGCRAACCPAARGQRRHERADRSGADGHVREIERGWVTSDMNPVHHRTPAGSR